jgi:ABC-type uncharacterized transport system permease subunit
MRTAWTVFLSPVVEMMSVFSTMALFPIDHFSTYALFVDDIPGVLLPDVTASPAGSSECTPLWVWGGLLFAVVVMGIILRFWRKREE